MTTRREAGIIATQRSFRYVTQFPGMRRGPEFFGGLIRQANAVRVLEIGAGANPTFSRLLNPLDKHGMNLGVNDSLFKSR